MTRPEPTPDPRRNRLRELAEAPEPRAAFTSLFFLSPGEGVTELFLIRHAQMALKDDMGGDEHLTDIGREQADALAAYLARFRFDAVYASPTLRAQQTAASVAVSQNLPVRVVEELRDVTQLRRFDRPLEEMVQEVYGPGHLDDFLEHMRREMSFDAMAPFLESSTDFRSRITRAMDEILDSHPGQRIAAVCHAPVISCYVSVLLNTTRDFSFNPKLTSITRILARDNDRTIDFTNATPHFEV
jgi:probable phosphoglycerate mutase